MAAQMQRFRVTLGLAPFVASGMRVLPAAITPAQTASEATICRHQQRNAGVPDQASNTSDSNTDTANRSDSNRWDRRAICPRDQVFASSWTLKLARIRRLVFHSASQSSA